MIQFLDRFIIYIFALLAIFGAFSTTASLRMNDGLAYLAQHWLFYAICSALWILLFELIRYVYNRWLKAIENLPTTELPVPDTQPLDRK